jgi:chemotaxis protein CheY-P-specific phosphatase CheC
MAEPLSNEKLCEIAAGLLADAAFMFAEPAPSSSAIKGDVVVARIVVETAGRHELLLCVERGLDVALAANLLGTENDEEEAKKSAADAVGELANIMAGTLAVELGGKKAATKIGLPRVKKEQGAAVWKEMQGAACKVDLVIENGARISIAVKQEKAP